MFIVSGTMTSQSRLEPDKLGDFLFYFIYFDPLKSSSIRFNFQLVRGRTSAMPAKSQRDSEAEVKSWGFPRVFTWSDGP